MQLNGSTLLVIDDDAHVRQAVVSHLESAGFVVMHAADVDEGQSLLATHSPQLVICDLNMTGRSGFSLVQTLAEEAPLLPVVVLSDTGDMNDVVEALRLGASDYLIKPIADLLVVEHAVRRSLDRARLRSENQRIRDRLEQANRELENHLKELRDDQAAGHQVQLNMLPPSPWQSGAFTLEHKIIPSLYLSGDFVDYFRVSDTQLAFYLADVSGHGASSAFVTVLLKFMTTRLLYEQRRREGEGHVDFKPSDVLGHINRSLISCKLGKHVTMLGGVIDEEKNQLTYSIGGHLPLPLMLEAGKARYLPGKGKPAGLFGDAVYEDHTIDLPASFTLLLCSDGVLDCIPGARLRDKEAALPQLLEAAQGDLARLLHSLLPEPEQTNKPDDISVMLLSRKEE